MTDNTIDFERLLLDEEDPDSGLVEDAFDVLPDELTLPFDYDELDLDLSEENFGRCSTSTTDDFSDLLELDGNLDTTADENNDNVFSESFDDTKLGGKDEQNGVCNTPILESSALNLISNHDNIDKKEDNIHLSNHHKDKAKDSTSSNGKLVSFSKEQARQWRRKRILNSCQKKIPVVGLKDSQGALSKQCPMKLEPLLPLPKNLKPVSHKKFNSKSISNDIKIGPKEKLANPLLGGEKLGTKTKRGPVPMKLRALPESFWKEPATIQTSQLVGSSYAVLPPLFSAEAKNSDVTNIRPVTPPDDKKNSPRHSPRSKKKIVVASNADTELLFSLFDHLESNKIDEKLIVRRGRPKKSTSDKVPPPPSRSMEEDPCIVDDLANKLFPDLSLHQKNKSVIPNYAMVRINKGHHTIEFPAAKANENYPTILNELVTHM